MNALTLAFMAVVLSAAVLSGSAFACGDGDKLSNNTPIMSLEHDDDHGDHGHNHDDDHDDHGHNHDDDHGHGH